jgi:hypothetical protein
MQEAPTEPTERVCKKNPETYYLDEGGLIEELKEAGKC